MAGARDRPRPAPSRGTARWLRRRTPLAALAAAAAGRPVVGAVPLHRLDPRLLLAAGIVEVVAFTAFLVTGSVAGFACAAAAAAAYAALHLADRRAVLALHEDGDSTVLGAGRSGRPGAATGPGPRRPALPPARGLAVPVELVGARWWVDRGAFAHLEAARRP